MWVKINHEYYQDPLFLGRGFAVRCDDDDGCRMIVRNIKTARDKMLERVRMNDLPIKLEMCAPQPCKEIIDGKLIDAVALPIIWKNVCDPVRCEVASKCVVQSCPTALTVMNEDLVEERV